MKFTDEQIKFLQENVFLENNDGLISIGFIKTDVIGNIWGSVEGNVWGNVRGYVLGNVGGNVWGNVWGDVGGSINGKKWRYVDE